MVLTYTGSLSVVMANQGDVRTMLIGAIGCNLAWGVIDGGKYMIACLNERGRKLLPLRSVRNAADLDITPSQKHPRLCWPPCSHKSKWK
jgi:hypothetical protein